MKVSGSIAWDDLSRNISGSIKDDDKRKKLAKQDHILIVSEADTKEEAKQSAVAYWTMGWNWDEIEAVLEDAEYPPAAITYAMNESKSYAREILNNGPFTTVRAGNLVCLNNGYVCRFVRADSEGVHVRVVGTTKKEAHAPSVELVISAEDVDKPLSKKLAKAYELEKNAENILNKLDRTEMTRSAGLSTLEQTSSIDHFVRSMRVVGKTVVDAMAALDLVSSTNDGTKSAAITRDKARLQKLAEMLSFANSRLAYLDAADLDDGTPEECTTVIANLVKVFSDYVVDNVESIPDEYKKNSSNVLNVTSAKRYDLWDGPAQGVLHSAVEEVTSIVASHQEYIQIKSAQKLFSSKDRR